MIDSPQIARFSNIQFADYLGGFMNIIDSTYLSPELVSVRYKCKELLEQFRREPLFRREELLDLDERRDEAFSGLRTCIEGYGFSYDPDIKKAALQLRKAFDVLEGRLYNAGHQLEVEKVDQLIGEWQDTEVSVHALRKLGLTAWVEELRIANLGFRLRKQQEEEEGTSAPGRDVAPLRQQMTLFFNEIHAYLNERITVADYRTFEEMAMRLNEFTESFHRRLPEN